ncbi:ubiquitin-conjugating enzyme E2 5A [Caerostris extrusa]|uniref:Ubiquitin-conjugating enzyme E2 5A n=1 Tax=Caerostris extrusa TaxID=172846 RepID=A0AAV4RBA8_CAEEX|nr:ubiquitin-conjugating enzyme E2 5A [Caerostris extrusa]
MNELNLHSDPPEGIEAAPLDEKCYHWQAYLLKAILQIIHMQEKHFIIFADLQLSNENHLLFVLLQKYFIPTSRHGDIIDSIHDNWSLILTISKDILISIQSLLTDPYCHVCMEPEIGRLYQENRPAFDGIARLWTMRFATLNKRPPILEKPSFLSQENALNPNL